MQRPSLFTPLLLALFTLHSASACFVRAPQPVSVWLDHIEVAITDQVAVKTYDCTFRNPNPRAVVGGTCYMEVEPDAQIDGLSVVVNGTVSPAELLGADKAREVFSEIVNEDGDTSLLEFYGSKLIRTRLARIAPNGVVKVKLRYTTVLKKRDDLVRLQVLNTNPKAKLQPLKEASVRVTITSSTPIKNVFSPTHPITLVEAPGYDIVVEWSEQNYLPEQPFVLYYSLADDPIGANALVHREAGESAGSFMVMLSPTIGSGAGRVADADCMPKDIVFCVDRSGSMLQGKKMEQAREALHTCLSLLRPKDRFNIVSFATSTRVFRPRELLGATAANIAAAHRAVDEMYGRGGTAMDEALGTSLALLKDSTRHKMIFFLTDGTPTIGETKPSAILKNVDRYNVNDTRLYVFGQGIDINSRLLDFLAADNRGEAEYVLPSEKAVDLVGDYFRRVGAPLMTDLKIEFDGIDAFDIYPKNLGDIYRGEQVVIFGRYRGDGRGELRLTGRVNGGQREMAYSLRFPQETTEGEHAFVPRLWAGAKVNMLLDQIRRSGREEPELVQEIALLAREHGIVTPYTGYLLVDDMIQQQQAVLTEDISRNLRIANTNWQNMASQPARNDAQTRANLVLQSKYQGFTKSSLRNDQSAWRSNLYVDTGAQGQSSGNLSSYFADGKVYGKAKAQSKDGQSPRFQSQEYSMNRIRYVGARTFYNSNGTWYDSRFQQPAARQLKQVKIASKDFNDLLTKNPKNAQYLALGNVVANIDGSWYQVTR
jgi:Ca-activated chloride channel family protein